MEAATRIPTPRSEGLDRESAVKLWSEIEGLSGVKRASLRCDTAGFFDAREMGLEEGARYFEIVVAGEVDSTTLSQIQAAAHGFGRTVSLISGTLTIR